MDKRPTDLHPAFASRVLANCPAELRELPIWVAWRRDIRNGEPTKIPVNPYTGGNAQTNNPSTWASMQDALDRCERDRLAGVGFCASADNPFCGIDFDHCVEPGGQIAADVLAEVDALASYGEVSPSGTGVHVYLRGKLPPGGCRFEATEPHIEFYDRGRFFTFTGQHLIGTPTAIEDRQEALDAAHARAAARNAAAETAKRTYTPALQATVPARGVSALGDDMLVEKARRARNGEKFTRLWAGDTSGYPSHSEADMALCNLLAFWTGGDPVQVDRLFRQSGLMRAKWDDARGETPIGAMTIGTALSSCSQFYDPARDNGHAVNNDLGEVDRDRPRLDAGIRTLEVLSDATWDAVLAANDPPRLFLHGGVLARLEEAEDGPTLQRLTADGLRYEVARAADWYILRKVEGLLRELPAQPPKDTIIDMLAYPAEALRLPAVDRIVSAPVYSANGVLQAAPGYHPAGRVFVNPSPGLRIPDVASNPSRESVNAAVALFDEMIGDFPFCDQADRAAAFALAILPFVRDMIDGPTPLHLIEAPAPGSGKGLLAAALLMPALGDNIGAMTQGRDEDEWRKRLTTRLREGKAALLIDNLTQPLDSGTLSSALTMWPLWGDRLLGTLDALNLPVRCAWVATANNPTLSTEIARRCVRMRIDAKTDRPFQREPAMFRHPDLRTWARQHRGELIASALALAQSWIAAGQPSPSVRPLGSYEEWSRVIGGILEHAGIGGFLGNLDELYERADQEGAIWRRFVEAWWDEHQDTEVGVADLYSIAVEMEDFPLGKGQERAQKTVLGMGLSKRRDMVLGGFRIEKTGLRKRLQQWRLTRTRPGQEKSKVYLGVPSVPFRSTPENIFSEDTASGKVHQGTLGTPVSYDDLADVCAECGAPVDGYDAAGRPYCERHMAAVSDDGDVPF
jgi:hypothetical protein